MSALSFPKNAFATVNTLYGVQVTMKANKIALSVFAAFRSFLFSLKLIKEVQFKLEMKEIVINFLAGFVTDLN